MTEPTPEREPVEVPATEPITDPVLDAAPPLPERERDKRTPPSWRVCPRCGGAIVDWPIHKQWHDAIETRAFRALQMADDVPGLDVRIGALLARIADFETRLPRGT